MDWKFTIHASGKKDLRDGKDAITGNVREHGEAISARYPFEKVSKSAGIGSRGVMTG
jgi:hypothetical protein